MPYSLGCTHVNLVLLHNRGDIPVESLAPHALRLTRVVGLLLLDSVSSNLCIHGNDRLNLSFNREDGGWARASACDLCQLRQD
jgi:hypothetical protein